MFVESNAVTGLAKRFAKVVILADVVFDPFVIRAHTKNHWHRLINRQVLQPAVAYAKRSERRHRQRHVVGKLLPKFVEETAVELTFRNRRIKINLDRGDIWQIERASDQLDELVALTAGQIRLPTCLSRRLNARHSYNARLRPDFQRLMTRDRKSGV